jgi:hypothetical protein
MFLDEEWQSGSDFIADIFGMENFNVTSRLRPWSFPSKNDVVFGNANVTVIKLSQNWETGF